MTFTEQNLFATAGDLTDRNDFAESIGNHRADPVRLREALIRTARKHLEARGMTEPQINLMAPIPTPPSGWVGMPTRGNVHTFALLIEFQDYLHTNSQNTINTSLFGQPASGAPYESLAAYYRRASYGILNLGNGTTLGWYQAGKNRGQIATTKAGREGLIKEAIQHFNNQGHDFSQYDNNGNGVIDYFMVFWTGPDTGWASFWWGYQTSFSDNNFTVDGVRLGKYSWQWETRPVGGTFSPRVAIHETGHALGLPDYYDYRSQQGPEGGVGGADMMDANQLDHNCFSKWMLDWLEPTVISNGSQTVTFQPSSTHQSCAAVMPGLDSGEIFSEYYMLQNRQKVENDVGIPGTGLMIWHVDATLDAAGTDFAFDNSYTSHKLLRLMEADGLEDIEALRGFNVGDLYVPGKSFGPGTTPSSKAYSGSDTTIKVHDIAQNGSLVQAVIDVGASLRYESSSGKNAPGFFQNNAPDNYNYEVLVRKSFRLQHYWCGYGNWTWNTGQLIGSGVSGYPAIFQNNAPGNNNYEVIIREGSHLQHYWYSYADGVWKKGEQFGTNVYGYPAVFQNHAPSNYNYEVLVREGNHIQHYWFGYGNWTWNKALAFGSNVTGQPVVFQNRGPGNYNYEVLVKEGNQIQHYWFQYGAWTWNKGSGFGNNVISDPIVFQNHAPGNFNYEVLVREGDHLQHYWFDYGNNTWIKGLPFGTNVLSDPTVFQNYAPGNFNYEVVVREGNHLQHYWFVYGNWVWTRGNQFGVNVQSDPAMFQNRASGNLNYELLVRESGRLQHYWFDYGNSTWNTGARFG